MKNNDFENISYNYYLNTTSYVKTILDFLPDEQVSKEKKAIIMEIYNYLLNGVNKEELSDIIKVSEKFNDQLITMSNQDIMIQVEFIYRNFLDKMVFDSYNRKKYFDNMNECVKLIQRLNQEYNDNFYEVNYNSIGNMRIR